MTAPNSGYVPYIDGLRAVAVLSVILYHLDPALLPGGFTGVDIFFVISGYVVSGSVSGLAGMKFGRFLAYFYARRLFRIAPALIVCLIVSALALDLFVPFAWLSGTNQKTSLAAFFGLSNFVLADSDNDYFSPRVDFNPFTQTWSLAVEEQFYLIFPWLFIFWLRGAKRMSIVLVLVLSLASLIWSAWAGAMEPSRAFYMITSRFWELGAGVLLFQAMAGNRFALPSGATRAVVPVSAILLGLGLALDTPGSTPFPGGALPVAGTLGLLWGLLASPPGTKLLTLLEHKIPRYIGRISYSLYLWHWPVFVLFHWTCGLQAWAPQLAALAITFGLGAASHAFIETPPRRAASASRRPRLALVCTGLVALAAGYGITSGLWALQPVISLSTVTRHATDWYPDAAVSDATHPGCLVWAAKARLGGGQVFVYKRTGCAEPVTYQHAMFVLGDSHAAAYLAMMKALVLQTGAPVHLYSIGGCSFIGLLSPPGPACGAFTEAALADMGAKLRPGDIVFLPSLRVPRLSDQFAALDFNAAVAQMSAPQTEAIRAAQAHAALPALQALAALRANIVLEAPTPVFPAPAFRCADWFDRANPICTGGTMINRAQMDQLRAPVLAVFASFMRQVAGVYVWDPLPPLCPGQVCSASQSGRPLFFDGDHLSAHGDLLLLPDFLRFIRALPAAPAGHAGSGV